MENNTLFNRADLSIEMLLSEIESGAVGLPKMQRRFVWKDSKIRDLLTSMLKGYPIGFVITWESPDNNKSKQIGTSEHGYSIPSKLIIDGQQRLTSLYCVFKGKAVEDSGYKERHIVISFNPILKRFEVATPALQKSAEWIYNISDVFQKGSAYEVATAFLTRLSEAREKKGENVKEEEKGIVFNNITALLNLRQYQVPTLDITSKAEEEDVSNIFVSINSGGTKLNQSDFILTLISVYWSDGRDFIEDFCEDTKKLNSAGRKDIVNPVLDLDPADVVRVVMAFGFKQARLSSSYKFLNGADASKKGILSDDLRGERFSQFTDSIKLVLNRDNFIEFIKCVESAGYVKKDLIGSKTNIVYAYAFYLIGKYDYKLKETELREVISKAIFVFALTSRYTGSFESQMKQDMDNLPQEKTYSAFKVYFDKLAESVLTQDFFSITLQGFDGLETTSSKSPAFLSYIAAQNILDTQVLFSKPGISTVTLYSQWANGARKAVELHHLFPKAYLRNTLHLDEKLINQVANYAFIEWPDNMAILDVSPKEYFPKQVAGKEEGEIKAMEAEHGLPYGWENMEYEEFLTARRRNMAQIIKKGFEKL